MPIEELAAAQAAIERRDLDAAIEALVRAYGIVRAPEIAALIGAVSDRLPLQQTIKSSRGRDKFLRIEEQQRAADVVAQLAAHEVVGGLLSIAKRPPDPRIAAEIASVLERLPKRAPSAKAYYQKLFAALVKIGDPRSAERLRAARPVAEELGVPSFRAWMLEQFDTAIAAIAALPAPLLADAARERAAAVEQAIAAFDGARTVNVDELFAQVYADPDDVGARVVLGDRLQEAQDPRGELIALQCLDRPLDRSERARINAILRDHRDALLGPIAPWVLANGLVFTHGFPSRGRVRDGLYSPGPPPVLVEWSTFLELDVAGEPSIVQQLAGSLRFLRRIEGATFAIVVTLDRLAGPTRLEHLGIRDRIAKTAMPNGHALERIVAMVAHGKPLAALRSLAVNCAGYDDRDRVGELITPGLYSVDVEVLELWLASIDCAPSLLARDFAARELRLVCEGVKFVVRRGDGGRSLGIPDEIWPGYQPAVDAVVASMAWTAVSRHPR